MIKLEKITKRYNGKTVLNEISFDFEEGCTYFITGKSGAGKSTLLKVISGLEKPDSGRVIYDSDLKKSFIFQNDRLLEYASCEDNIKFVNKNADCKSVLESVGLSGLEKTKVRELSGGMKRRLAIARAVAYGGNCFFADEPLNSLDKDTKKDIVSLLKNTTKDKMSFIVTHSVEDFDFKNSIILLIENGKICKISHLY